MGHEATLLSSLIFHMMIDEGSMAGGCVSSFISVKNPTDHNFSEQFLSRIFQRKFTSRRSDEI